MLLIIILIIFYFFLFLLFFHYLGCLFLRCTKSKGHHIIVLFLMLLVSKIIQVSSVFLGVWERHDWLTLYTFDFFCDDLELARVEQAVMLVRAIFVFCKVKNQIPLVYIFSSCKSFINSYLSQSLLFLLAHPVMDMLHCKERM